METRIEQAKQRRVTLETKKIALAAKRKALEEARANRDSEASKSGKGPQKNASDEINVLVQSLLDKAAVEQAEKAGADIREGEERERQRMAKIAALTSHHNVVSVSIPPREVVKYSVGVQTRSSGDIVEGDEGAAAPAARAGGGGRRGKGVSFEGSGGGLVEISVAQEKSVAKEPMSEEAASELMQRGDFVDFWTRASRMMERALVSNTEYNPFVDYGADESAASRGKSLLKKCRLYSESLCKDRSITDIAFSPKYPELVVVAYSAGTTDFNERSTQGMVILWNIMANELPEMIFYCADTVLRAFISPFNPNLVVGSTQTGQIVTWDKTTLARGERSLARPTARTALSVHGQTMPIFSLDVVGTENANTLVSTSTDGKQRAWNVTHLQDPVAKMNLIRPVQDTGKTRGAVDERRTPDQEVLAVTSSSFVPGDASSCIMGSEDGDIYLVSRHARSSSGPVSRTFVGHDAPITAVDCHPSKSAAVNTSVLFLSSSMDWTVRLWDRRRGEPLHTMEDGAAYVYDVKWSPTNPGIFVSCDGMGVLSIWDLSVDMDAPITKVEVLQDDQDKKSANALNKLTWNSDGKSLCVGTSKGECYVFEASKDIHSPGDPRQLQNNLAKVQGL